MEAVHIGRGPQRIIPNLPNRPAVVFWGHEYSVVLSPYRVRCTAAVRVRAVMLCAMSRLWIIQTSRKSANVEGMGPKIAGPVRPEVRPVVMQALDTGGIEDRL